MTAETNNILPPPKAQFFTLSGIPLAGGMVYTYAADGVTPKTTYQDSSTSTPNANPVVLDSSGYASIWGQGQYVFAVTDALGSQVYGGSPTQDPVASLGVSAAMLPVIQATTTAAALAALGAAAAGAGIVPFGVPLPYAGASPPSGWAQCYGQAVSRSMYPNLFFALGTTWGAGDGATTFNLPDLRGRLWAGLDNMGGSAANRLTSDPLGFATAADSIGVTGGSQYMASHNHGVSDPGHEHSISLNIAGNTSPGGGYTPGASTGTYNTDTATTSITITDTGSGLSGNCPPLALGFWIIQLG